jgi:hypothetical protein
MQKQRLIIKTERKANKVSFTTFKKRDKSDEFANLTPLD